MSVFTNATLSTVAAAKAMFSQSAKVPHAFANASRPAPSKRRQPWDASTAKEPPLVGTDGRLTAARARTAARVINAATGELDHSPQPASRDSSATRGGLYRHTGLYSDDSPAASAAAPPPAGAAAAGGHRPTARLASPAPPSDEECYLGTSAGSVGGASRGSNGSVEREQAVNHALRPGSPTDTRPKGTPSPPKTARGSRALTWQEEQALVQKKRAATGKLAAWQFQNTHGLGDAKGRTEPLVFDGKVCFVCEAGASRGHYFHRP
jgi:hypothetical protein